MGRTASSCHPADITVTTRSQRSGHTLLVWFGTFLHKGSSVLEELHWDLSQLLETFSCHCFKLLSSFLSDFHGAFVVFCTFQSFDVSTGPVVFGCCSRLCIRVTVGVLTMGGRFYPDVDLGVLYYLCMLDSRRVTVGPHLSCPVKSSTNSSMRLGQAAFSS